MDPGGRLAFVLAAIGLSGLLATAILWGVPHVEADLERRTDAAIVQAGFDDIGVAVDGRDVSLRGRSERDIEPQLRAVLASIDGLRSIDTRISRLERPPSTQGGD